MTPAAQIAGRTSFRIAIPSTAPHSAGRTVPRRSLCAPCAALTRLARTVCAVLTACVLLASTGCSPTDIDVYIATSQLTTSADGTVIERIERTLDEHANAIGTLTVNAAGAQSHTEASYDIYGAPAGAAEIGDVDFDEKGQPTRIACRTADGALAYTLTYTYTDIKGRIATAERIPGPVTSSGADSAGTYGYSVRFDRDGWPLNGTLTLVAPDGTVEAGHILQFVYEVTETGAVTTQIVQIDGTEAARYTFEYDENMKVAVRHNPDGTSTAYTYELAKDPSPAAMAQALAHEPDYAYLAELAGPVGLAV